MRWWEELQGPLLGRYRVDSLIGRGGMAEVLLAHDERLAGRRVAIKAPTLDSFAPAQLAELLLRFQREVQRQGSESISGVVAILDAGEIVDSRGNSQPFLVMDYLPGGSLGDRLGGSSGRRERTQTLGEVLAWLRPVATTLDRLHARKYLHRDVKPDNILFNADGDPLLADFGIATSLDEVAGAGTMMSVMGSAGPGSPGYQSPESLRGDKLAASDQFSLAVTAYEALTGRLPMNATTRDAWIGALANWRPTPLSELRPESPPAATEVLMRALSVEPRDRFLSCSQFAHALANAIAAVPAATPPSPDAAPRVANKAPASDAIARAPSRTRPWFRWAAALGVLAILGLCGLVWWAVYPELRNDALREDDALADNGSAPSPLVIDAHSFGPEGDTREITEAALKTHRLERVFNAAAQLATMHAENARAAPADAAAGAVALESSLDAARKGRIAAESAQALAAIASNWLDNYRERGASLMDYALDVAQRAAEFARQPPAPGASDGNDRFARFAEEATVMQQRIAAEIARRKELGNVPDAAGPAGAFELEKRVAGAGPFFSRYSEYRRKPEGASTDTVQCDNEDDLKRDESGKLRHTYYGACFGSLRFFITRFHFDSPSPQSKDSMAFTAVTSEVRCVWKDNDCPEFAFEQPQDTAGLLELVTEDLVLIRVGKLDGEKRPQYFLMARDQEEPVAVPVPAAPAPRAVAAKPVPVRPEPAKPAARPAAEHPCVRTSSCAGDIIRQLDGLQGIDIAPKKPADQKPAEGR